MGIVIVSTAPFALLLHSHATWNNLSVYDLNYVTKIMFSSLFYERKMLSLQFKVLIEIKIRDKKNTYL